MHKIVKMGLCVGVAFVMNICLAFAAEDEDRPIEHFCPISREVMRKSFLAADGFSYEEKNILQHFQSGGVNSPVTGLPLKNRELIENKTLQKLIRDWKPGRKSGPSELDTREVGTIAERVEKEFRKNAALLNAAKGQHIVALFGNEGSGKSTLVNLLTGKKLIPSEDGEDYILADPRDSTAMAIGTTGNSQTLYPQFIDVDGLRFFDLPGFNDTDGSERNLVNAAFIRKILLDAASVRLVLVAGQDQFTADRGAPFRNMLQSLKHLFVADNGTDPIDNGVFVATKITCTDQTELAPFLLKKTDARDNGELKQQLQSWRERKRMGRMFHPLRDTSNIGMRDQILELIHETEPTKIVGLNVSALYPPNTKGALERLFSKLLEDVFERHLNAPLSTLADYEHALTVYSSASFWPTFDATACEEEKVIGLLKEFCITSYMKALRRFEGENEGKRQTYIQGLKAKKNASVEDLSRRSALLDEGVPFSSSTPMPLTRAIDRHVSNIVIPEVARGYEDIYRRFYNGKLIYRPTEGSDEGMIELPIADLANPLDGTFDLRNCGNAGQGLSIATGYRKVQTPANANKIEIWLTPRFLIERELNTLPQNHHMREILKTWGVAYPVGMFWTWGGWNAADHMEFCDCLTSQSMEELGSENFYKKWGTPRWPRGLYIAPWRGGRALDRTFHISFVPQPDSQEEANEQRFREVEDLSRRSALLDEGVPFSSSTPMPLTRAIDRPVSGIVIPEVARGYEEVYRRFYNGKLIYRPTVGSDVGKVELRIADLANPLDGTFDLSNCGDTGQGLSIATGYRKVQTPANANKIEIWLTPRFLIERELNTLPQNHHMREILKTWGVAYPVGMFWTWGGWNAADHMEYCDYLTSQSMEELGSENFYKKWSCGRWIGIQVLESTAQFHISFVPPDSQEEANEQRFRGVEDLSRQNAPLEERAPFSSSTPTPLIRAIERPVSNLVIPAVALGHEDVYRRFYNGKLIYRPTPGSDEGKVELRIADLADPLGSTFNLRNCGDTGQGLSIATGYRKVQTPANANKIEIWLTPRFLIERELNTLPQNHHMREILKTWGVAYPVGIFWTWGGWNAADHMEYCDYLTSQSMEELGSRNLYEKWLDGRPPLREGPRPHARPHFSHFVFELR